MSGYGVCGVTKFEQEDKSLPLSLWAMKVCALPFLCPTLMNRVLVTKEAKEKMKDSMMEKSVN